MAIIAQAQHTAVVARDGTDGVSPGSPRIYKRATSTPSSSDLPEVAATYTYATAGLMFNAGTGLIAGTTLVDSRQLSGGILNSEVLLGELSADDFTVGEDYIVNLTASALTALPAGLYIATCTATGGLAVARMNNFRLITNGVAGNPIDLTGISQIANVTVTISLVAMGSATTTATRSNDWYVNLNDVPTGTGSIFFREDQIVQSPGVATSTIATSAWSNALVLEGSVGAAGETPIAFYSANSPTNRPTTVPYSTEWTEQGQLNPDVDYNWIIWGEDDFTGGTLARYRAAATGTTGVTREDSAGSNATATFDVVDGASTPTQTNQTSERYTVSITGDTGRTDIVAGTSASQVRVMVPNTSVNQTITLLDNVNEEMDQPRDKDWTVPWNLGQLTYQGTSIGTVSNPGEFRANTSSNQLRFEFASVVANLPFNQWHSLETIGSSATTLRTDATFVVRFSDPTFGGPTRDVTYTSILLDANNNYILGGITLSGSLISGRSYNVQFIRRAVPSVDFTFHSESLAYQLFDNMNPNVVVPGSWVIRGPEGGSPASTNDLSSGWPTSRFDLQIRWSGFSNYITNAYLNVFSSYLNISQHGASQFFDNQGVPVEPPGNFFVRIESDASNFAEYKIRQVGYGLSTSTTAQLLIDPTDSTTVTMGSPSSSGNSTITIFERSGDSAVVPLSNSLRQDADDQDAVNTNSPGSISTGQFTLHRLGTNDVDGSQIWSGAATSTRLRWPSRIDTNRQAWIVNENRFTVRDWLFIEANSTDQVNLFNGNTVTLTTPTYIIVRDANNPTQFHQARIDAVRSFPQGTTNSTRYALILDEDLSADNGGNYFVDAANNYDLSFWQQPLPNPIRDPVDPAIIAADFVSKFNANTNLRDFFREASLVGNDAQFTTYGIGDFDVRVTAIDNSGDITIPTPSSTNIGTPAYENSEVAINLLGEDPINVVLRGSLDDEGIASALAAAIDANDNYSAEVSTVNGEDRRVSITRTPVGEVDVSIVSLQINAPGSGNLLITDFTTPTFSDGTNQVIVGRVGSLEYNVGDFNRTIQFLDRGSNADSIRSILMSDVLATGAFTGTTTDSDGNDLGTGIVDFTGTSFGPTTLEIVNFDPGVDADGSDASAMLTFTNPTPGAFPTSSSFALSNIQRLGDDGTASFRFTGNQPAYIIRPAGSNFIPAITGGEITWSLTGFEITTNPTVTGGTFRATRPAAEDLNAGETLFDVSFNAQEPTTGNRSPMMWNIPLLDTIPLLPAVPTTDGLYRLRIANGVATWEIG